MSAPDDRAPAGGAAAPGSALADVAARLDVLRNRVADAGGDPARVELLAVTKGFGLEAVLVARELGLVDVGENYAQELVTKAAALDEHDAAGSAAAGAPAPVRWHAIGRLQRNKVASLAGLVHLWQSVDRAALGREIARRAPGASVLVQVNVSGEEQKGGASPEQVADLARALRDDGLDVRGLMAVGATGPPEEARLGFRTLRALADDLDLPVRSMGMSADLEVAVQEGATMLRVGTALFGARPPRSSMRDYRQRVQED